MRWLMSCAIIFCALMPNVFFWCAFLSLADKSLQFSEQHQLLSFVLGSSLAPSTGYQMLLTQARDPADDSIPLVESMILGLIVLTKSKKGGIRRRELRVCLRIVRSTKEAPKIGDESFS
ncbi:hypothetical protein B0T10DRAFT_480561 [Thelonectria olida]|uniref:Uncharacterized protein n=1 Tax=Thelonectria olida TaxID=1576542 RepID=A0A9P8WBE7_9HYPO|nr:hypothetical protein B0T10DRAFT_480561 [Thelonectria olida]